MDFGSFFNTAQGTVSSSGKAGGAGYSSDVKDSGKTATDISVIVGGIGTTTADQATGAAPPLGFNPAVLYLALGAFVIYLVLKK